ncbi:MAG TPA: hypothetical protein VEO01_42435, partial [Pseudonocardiaceae bacterium]|nr:hypothetical protein [Pseudonocardiaceae bacterium]
MSASTLSPPAEHTVAPPVTTSRPGVVRGALAVLLVGTAVLYLWNLSASGYANDFYAPPCRPARRVGRRCC